ncbi:MAG: hypothetical protein JNK78_04790 [Planctomycetes bacterium]|nr:hypothetical protein [Planctomycetota bacterium]
MTARYREERLRRLLSSLDDALRETDAALDARAATIDAVPAERRASAENLAMYLALRAHDLRPLQHDLHDLSLSSLGRMEGHVAATLHGVRFALRSLLGEPGAAAPPAVANTPSGDDADRRLLANADELLGPSPTGRRTRVMVTLAGDAATDPGRIDDLLRAGMDVARINLAHDDERVWSAMVANVRAAAVRNRRPCRILADLPGPKLRIGDIEPGPEVVRVRPARDAYGIVEKPAKVLFRDPNATTNAEARDIVVPLRAPLVCFAEVGDEFVVTDTRGRRRTFVVTTVDGVVCTAVTDRTAYLGTGCAVLLQRGITELATTELGRMPALPGTVAVHAGDILIVTRDDEIGRGARTTADGRIEPARIPCAMPEVFDDVLPDQRILFDDGRVAGIVLAHERDGLRVRITGVPPGGARLRTEKGINLPDTRLRAPAVTADDTARLDWAATHADMVGLSFVQHPEDVLELQQELRSRGAELGIVLKIETATAFQRLPDLLFAGLRSPRVGVMVARGDLAVEVGYARLAEVQEEILWLCEAAHVPVVWATQVLDSMARTGVPSRAEVTDAAMGVQAECVMLNKGPHIVATVAFLSGVLERMQEHHAKKHSLLRRLRIATPTRP